MFYSLASYYFFIKLIYLFSLVRAQVKFEPMKDHYLFLGALYTAGVTFLSYVFLMSYQAVPDWREWEVWLGKTFLLSTFYFWLLAKFDEGFIFWVLLALGVLLVWY